ncbi:sugar isomerase (SIS) [Desulfarculus baarsii DSM 2075]|uniref:Phosphoheptose isomerase n=1 Tax=Desulfarculus baarsii (strain ATCC 33931 / DSM 2075 / LMG 7858 / VKM B-1802 / 2st14) TaxID=644282 RepID=E1QF46_DESB2|nr:SIS domain-containing protein [Desulfarculus baarsii]ADK84182.1 sugar isomerase (SIS) [Desulfarculus baarsii DSM 2075]
MMQAVAAAGVQKTIAAMEQLLASGLGAVTTAAAAIAKAFSDDKKMLCFGNGGSAADAQHLAAEMVNRFMLERPSLPCLALTTDASVLTSIANDYAFGEIFSKQIKALGAAGDVALGISTSGNSPNVLEGLRVAQQRGLLTIGLTGRGGGAMAALCDILVAAPTDETPRIQEVHAVVIHLICELVDLTLFGRAK